MKGLRGLPKPVKLLQDFRRQHDPLVIFLIGLLDSSFQTDTCALGIFSDNVLCFIVPHIFSIRIFLHKTYIGRYLGIPFIRWNKGAMKDAMT